MPVPTVSVMKHDCGAEVFQYKSHRAVSVDQQRLVKVTPVLFLTGMRVSYRPS